MKLSYNYVESNKKSFKTRDIKKRKLLHESSLIFTHFNHFTY